MGTPEVKVKLDDGSLVCLAWLQSGGLAVARYKAGSWSDGHGWLLTGNGVIDASTVAVFLAASEPLPPRAATPTKGAS